MVAGSEDEVRLEHPDGALSVVQIAPGRRRLTVDVGGESTFVQVRTWETAYPLDLIALILRVKGLRSVCEEIKRDEDPDYLQHALWWTIRAHVDVEDVGSARILDFGSGSGASTMILARMFPAAFIVGLDIDTQAHEVAEARRRFYGMDQVEFRLSTTPDEILRELGNFDYIAFCALYEHLLPAERKMVIPALWNSLEPGGLVFVGETPHRFGPIEVHTTGGLPLVNYLPSAVALRVVTRMSQQVEAGVTWSQLLRRGLRGGTERQFMRILADAGHHDAAIERPTKQGVKDQFDLWYRISRGNGPPGVKSHLRTVFRALHRILGISFTPYLAFAVRKRPHS